MLCMGYRESHLSPNAKGARQDIGMFQVLKGNIRKAISSSRFKRKYKLPPVTPGFRGLSWNQYMTRMLDNPMAQADLSHIWIMAIAKDLNLFRKFKSGRVSDSDYRRLLATYNGGPKGPRRSVPKSYARKIMSCVKGLRKGIVSPGGRVNGTSRQLLRALRKAQH